MIQRVLTEGESGDMGSVYHSLLYIGTLKEDISIDKHIQLCVCTTPHNVCMQVVPEECILLLEVFDEHRIVRINSPPSLLVLLFQLAPSISLSDKR